MKNRMLLSSIMIMVLCFTLISGATFALFTSESKVNIAVTSGKVELVANVENIETWSLENDYNVAGRTDGSFSQGGTATFAGATLTLDKMIPGDRVSFEITGQNNSNVATQYRVKFACSEAYLLMAGLEVTINGETYTSLLSYTSDWAPLAANAAMQPVEVSIELPQEAGNEFQDLAANILVAVEAIQGNAEVTGAKEVVTFAYVANEEELSSALKDKNVVMLASDVECTEGTSLEVPANHEVELQLNGKTITNAVAGAPALVNNGTLTINGNGTIVNGTSTQSKSHTIRNYGTLVIENGTFGTSETAGAAIVNDGDATINGGTYYSKQENVKADGLCAYVFINNGAGTLTINDALVNSETHGLFGAYNGELIVNGGSYTLWGNNGLGCYIVYSAAAGKVTLNKGTFTAVTPRNNNYYFVYNNGNYFNEKAVEIGNVVVGAEAVVNVIKSTSPNYAATEAKLSEAISAGETTIYLAAGDYVIPAAAKGKTLTIKGTKDTNVKVTKVGTGGENCDYGFDGSTVVLDGVTITTNSSTYIGYARCNATYNNCTINGTYTLYGDSVFNNCTFNVSGDVYNIWTWGAPTATFNECTFNSDGKALLLYGTANTKLTVNGCTFNDNGGLADLKAAIEIGNDYNKSYELIVNNTVVNGYEINDKGINTNTTLWANKNSMGTDKLNVVVDGVDVY